MFSVQRLAFHSCIERKLTGKVFFVYFVVLVYRFVRQVLKSQDLHLIFVTLTFYCQPMHFLYIFCFDCNTLLFILFFFLIHFRVGNSPFSLLLLLLLLLLVYCLFRFVQIEQFNVFHNSVLYFFSAYNLIDWNKELFSVDRIKLHSICFSVALDFKFKKKTTFFSSFTFYSEKENANKLFTSSTWDSNFIL